MANHSLLGAAAASIGSPPVPRVLMALVCAQILARLPRRGLRSWARPAFLSLARLVPSARGLSSGAVTPIR